MQKKPDNTNVGSKECTVKYHYKTLSFTSIPSIVAPNLDLRNSTNIDSLIHKIQKAFGANVDDLFKSFFVPHELEKCPYRPFSWCPSRGISDAWPVANISLYLPINRSKISVVPGERVAADRSSSLNNTKPTNQPLAQTLTFQLPD